MSRVLAAGVSAERFQRDQARGTAPASQHRSGNNDRSRGGITRLASIPGAQLPDDDMLDRNRVTIVITKPSGDTMTGSIELSGGRMRADANSIERADALKTAIELAAGELVRYRLREETSIDALLADEDDAALKP